MTIGGTGPCTRRAKHTRVIAGENRVARLVATPQSEHEHDV
jgi:hypothetical protein